MRNLIFVFFTGIMMVSCNKEKVKAKAYEGPPEQFIAGYIQANASIFINTSSTSDLPLEYGIIFQSAKKGIITAMGIRMPVAGAKYTISLWEHETKQLLKQYKLVNAVSNGFNYMDMEAISETVGIAANKKYVISVFVQAEGQTQPWPYYFMIKPSGAGAAENFIPFTQGSLTCAGTLYTRYNTPSFPDQPVLHNDIINGLCDIIFRATEK